MAGYESAQLVESFHEEGVEKVAVQRQRAGPWRRVGLAAAVVATLGAAVGTTLRSKPMTPVQRFHKKMQNSLLNAFSTRALAEAADLTARFSFIFAEVDQEDPSKMSMEAKVETTDEEVASLTVTATFAAQEGKGDDLVAQFKKVVAGLKSYLAAEQGQEAADMVDGIVSVEAGEEDEAVITFTPPPLPESDEEKGQFDKEFVASLKPKPKFTASVSTGRSIKEMYEHLDENIALLPGGVAGHVDAAFAHTLFKAIEDEVGGGEFEKEGPNMMQVLGAMASISEKLELRYRSGSTGFDSLPKLDGLAMSLAMAMGRVPAAILEPTAGLADVADGLKTLEISGLPHNYGLLATFTNFHITPLLKTLIEEAQKEEAASPMLMGVGAEDE